MAFVPGRKGADGVVDSLAVSSRAKQFSSFVADIDLTSSTNNPHCRCCRGFIVNLAGGAALAYTMADGSTDTIDVTDLQGVFIPLSLRSITSSGTTISKIIIFY